MGSPALDPALWSAGVMAHATEVASGPVTDLVFDTAAAVYEDARSVLESVYGPGALPCALAGFEGFRFVVYEAGRVWRVTELSAGVLVSQDLTPGTAKARASLRLASEGAAFRRAVADVLAKREEAACG